MKTFMTLAVLLACTSAVGATFTVEDTELKAPPKSVSAAVQRFSKGEFVDRSGSPCQFIGRAVALRPEGAALDWVVTTADACSWAASAAPVWVVRETGGAYAVVLFHVTYDLTLGSAAVNGLRNIATARATAARREEQLWKFDGQQYRVASNRVR